MGKATLECTICLNEFEDDEMLRLIPKCSHVYHLDCIDAWLSSHSTCPACRTDLVLKSDETISVTTNQVKGSVSDPENRTNENNIGDETSVNQESDIETQEANSIKSNSIITENKAWRLAWLFSQSHSTEVGEGDTDVGESLGRNYFNYERLLKLRSEAIPILNIGVSNSKSIWEELLLDRLLTRERLIRMGITTVDSCILCNDALERRNHLFADCAMVDALWNGILNLSLLDKPRMFWDSNLAWASSTWKGKSLLTTILKIAWCSFIYYV
ncbi:hypothetical protein F3Y22_tig00112498pilonHSYRG00198 [Hibiscus syriacus]|uniref:RING-type E3 ubiquitin transferase n=1 Tax=Hibiscus syriacus TaxID=106335 RepID=A0A6A2Y8Z9_HIBSY|nr:hypothetical protein F3Y22_tig00112498pilonHSYRG00198 [Hibiscus syriacus]